MGLPSAYLTGKIERRRLADQSARLRSEHQRLRFSVALRLERHGDRNSGLVERCSRSRCFPVSISPKPANAAPSTVPVWPIDDFSSLRSSGRRQPITPDSSSAGQTESGIDEDELALTLRWRTRSVALCAGAGPCWGLRRLAYTHCRECLDVQSLELLQDASVPGGPPDSVHDAGESDDKITTSLAWSNSSILVSGLYPGCEPRRGDHLAGTRIPRNKGMSI